MIRSATVSHVSMPLAAAFSHARATRAVADNVVVRIDVDGVEGLGECVPRDYVTGESVDSVMAALTSFDLSACEAAAGLRDLGAAARAVEALRLPERLRQNGRPGLAATCALELAILDAVGKRAGLPLRAVARALDLPAAMIGKNTGPYDISHTVDLTHPAEEVLGDLARPPHHVKVKVGAAGAADIERVRSVRSLVGPNVPVSVDANMAWSLEQAVSMAHALEPFSIAWYEEPLAQRALTAYREFREATGARVMLDESLCTLEDGQAAIAAGACDLFNLRLSKCGGFVATLRLAALAHHSGLASQLGAQIGEMAILAAAARQFAGCVAHLAAYTAPGIDRRFKEQIVQEQLTVDRTNHQVQDLPGHGLGVTLAAEVLARHTRRSATWRHGSWTSSPRP